MNGQLKWTAVAALLHAAIAVWLLSLTPTPKAKVDRSVAVVLFAPRLPNVQQRAVVPAPKPQIVARSASSRGPSAAPNVSHTSEGEQGGEEAWDGPTGVGSLEGGSGSPDAGSAGSLSRRIVLPGYKQVAGFTSPVKRAPEPTDLQRAEAMLAGMKLEHQLKTAALHGARGVLVDVKKQFAEKYMPSAVALGEVLSGTAKPTVPRPPPKPITEDRVHQALAPAAAERDVAMGSLDQSFILFELYALIRLQHREGDGQVESAHVQQSSGINSFDLEAMAAANQAVGSKLPARPGEPLPEWSDWKFSQTVYKYGVGAQMLEPGFKPPGKPVPEHGVYVDAELKFVTAMYRKPAPTERPTLP